MNKFLLCSALLITLVFTSCTDDSSLNGGIVSEGSSHNTGKNCLNCHSFKIAGSVFNQALTSTYTSATIKLTTEAGGAGTALSTFTSDKSGNYYTSKTVNFGKGVYVSVTGTGGTTKYMSSAITNGACNSCHNGTVTLKVWIE